ncbi:hypothetical protein M427DRAFT_51222 [Gonapodya prolifera JEL478]|uniref:Uncharacterized protein n=1 Tax=Gonapodya prolifera (strain JEL478) TaxID=1344416 RepID=A0A139AYS3_GONPJ|nr:hypothetical protein M427DRAFT_51222 [Gonapodya prolifera JEL478]|eukprot:KXS21854.1 hypothetical protein M427DRAFT_51222 [Gonapodya prolifera JEL478]
MAEQDDGSPTIVEENLRRAIGLRDLQLADPFNRTLSVPMIVRSKRHTSKVLALGRFRAPTDDVPIGYQSSFPYFSYLDPLGKRDMEYITTFTPEYTYEVKANDPEGFHDNVYVERSVTGAWIRLLKDINSKMVGEPNVYDPA